MQNPQTIRNTLSLAERLAPDTEAVAEILRQQVASHVPLVSEIASHLLDAAGKRLRPLLTCAAAHLCETPPDDLPKAHKLAAAVELMHSATLLHDDVVDLGQLRRGQPAANVLWGNKASVLTGDFLLGRAFGLIVEVGCPAALQVLARAAITVSEGEMLGLRTTRRTDLTRAEIIAVMEGKTAALFSAACEAGACLVEPDGSPNTLPPRGSKRAALAEFGQAVGLAFQMVDDLLDYEGGSAITGKAAGDDLRDGRMTLPVWLAWQAGNESERAFWHRALVEETPIEQTPVEQTPVKLTSGVNAESVLSTPPTSESASQGSTGDIRDNLKQAQALLTRHKIGDKVREEASGLLGEADMILKGFPASSLREAMARLVREGSRRIS